jgi:hypothetical protein
MCTDLDYDNIEHRSLRHQDNRGYVRSPRGLRIIGVALLPQVVEVPSDWEIVRGTSGHAKPFQYATDPCS